MADETNRTETLQSQHNTNLLRHLWPSHYHGGTREEPGTPPEGYVPPLEQLVGDVTISNDYIESNEPIDTVVGTLLMPDGTTGTPTFEMIDDANGAFKVGGEELLVAKDGVIGFVTYTVTVKGTAVEGWAQSDIDITVNP
jgi:hypothetical protein